MQKVIILGAGESGTGAAILAKQLGYEVFVSDMGKIAEIYKAELQQLAISFEEAQHSIETILKADLIIKSPGIANENEIIQKIKEKGLSIISEIEFAGQHTDAKIIAITGTNGKTTTTTMCYEMLKKAGLNVGLGGNIGKSFARQVAQNSHDYYVLEISSFQLDDCYSFKPHIAILTNITPDHLDRYEYQMEKYASSKFRITQAQDENDVFIYCADDEFTLAFKPTTIKAKAKPFSAFKILADGGFKKDDKIILQKENKEIFNMNIQQLGLKGMHNMYNGTAAAIMGNVLNIKNEIIRESLTNFENIEHRLEQVATINGVTYINDSKATNVNAVWYALESIDDKPIIWVAGGVDKGNDYSMIMDLVKERVKIIICLGVDNLKIHQTFAAHVDMILNTTSASDAVNAAYKFANKGDAVLLSPACASFDLFDNYEDRGRKFKAAVKAL